MSSRRRERVIYLLAVWSTAVLVAMVALDALALDQYFVAGLVGAILVERTATSATVSPRWRVRLRRVIGLGVLGFAAIVGWRILQLLTGGAF